MTSQPDVQVSVHVTVQVSTRTAGSAEPTAASGSVEGLAELRRLVTALEALGTRAQPDPGSWLAAPPCVSGQLRADRLSLSIPPLVPAIVTAPRRPAAPQPWSGQPATTAVAAPATPTAAPSATPTAAPSADQATAALWIRPATREVFRHGSPVHLTRREFDLLEFLSRNPRRVFRRAQLLRTVWGHEAFAGGERTIDVHVRRLRGKLGDHTCGIATLRGVGYRFDSRPDVTVVLD